VEAFVIFLLVVCILFVIFYPIYNKKKPKIFLSIFFAVILIPLGYEEYNMRITENRLTSIARAHANLDNINIKCDRLSQYAFTTSQKKGEVYFEYDGTPSNLARIMYRPCQSILPLISNRVPISPSLDQIVSLHVVSHEIQHLLGVQDEAVAECLAIQNNIEFFKMFKIIEPENAAKRYYKELYPKMPMRYRTAECVNGGKLDLNLSNSVFE